MKDRKFYIITFIVVVAFVLGLKLGENHTIRHQKIEKTNTGYSVEFEGRTYNYTED